MAERCRQPGPGKEDIRIARRHVTIFGGKLPYFNHYDDESDVITRAGHGTRETNTELQTKHRTVNISRNPYNYWQTKNNLFAHDSRTRNTRCCRNPEAVESRAPTRETTDKAETRVDETGARIYKSISEAAGRDDNDDED